MDELRDSYEAIRASAIQRGFTLYPEAMTPERGVTSSPWMGRWEEFLDIAVKLGAFLLYIGATEFDFDRAVTDALREVGHREPGPEELGEGLPAIEGSHAWYRMRINERFREYGQLRSYGCAWYKEGVCHYFGEDAEWYAAFDEGLFEVMEESQLIRRESRYLVSPEDAKRIQELASEMARHQRWGEANNDSKRDYLAEMLFPDEPENIRVRSVELAGLIYWWDIEPRERVTKAERVWTLHEAGYSMVTIGQMVKLSAAKVSRYR